MSDAVIRGLFPLLTAELKAAFDVRIWLDPPEELKWSWKVKRDSAQHRPVAVPVMLESPSTSRRRPADGTA